MAAAYKATDCLSSSKVTFKISSFPSPEKTRFIKTTNQILHCNPESVQVANSGRKTYDFQYVFFFF